MKFGPVPLGEARGAILAHSLKIGSGRIAKGRVLDEADIAALVALFKVTLGEAVKDVRGSEALTESAVRLVADEGDMDLHLERMLRRHGQIDGAASRRVLELNPRHRLVQGLARSIAAGEDRAAALAPLLLDQARIAEGEAPDDPAAFARLLADALADSLPAG